MPSILPARIPREIGELFSSLEYAVRMTPQDPYKGKVYHVDFTVLKLHGLDDAGAPMWQRADSHFSPDPVGDIDLAEWYMRGTLKWDGCVDYEINRAHSSLHACDLQHFRDLATLWEHVYAMAAQLMPDTHVYRYRDG